MTGIWDLERKFWLEGVERYESSLAADATMVFPEPAGVMSRAAILESLRAAPRWRDVRVEPRGELPLPGGAVLITYRATATRDGGDAAYVTLASSVYVPAGEEWRLLFHQQTPVAP